MMIFNQFAEMGNPLWHYNVTGYALSDLFENTKKPGQRLAGACFTSGSAGTMSAGDLLKERYPGMKLAVGEALQCPTILDNGFGGHRIEGIGDKHIPWVHNVKNTDMVIDIDDEDSQRLLRLFNCKEGQEYLKSLGLSDEQIEKFTWMGISGIANVLCCIKFAKYYELTEDDVVVTVLTDSAVMYKSGVIFMTNFNTAQPEDLYSNTVGTYDWSGIQAVQDQRVYKMPLGMYRSYTPGIDTPITLLWMAKTVYPTLFEDIDVTQRAIDYYQEVFGVTLTAEQVEQIFAPISAAGTLYF